MDDFGDVYSIYLAMHGDEYTTPSWRLPKTLSANWCRSIAWAGSCSPAFSGRPFSLNLIRPNVPAGHPPVSDYFQTPGRNLVADAGTAIVAQRMAIHPLHVPKPTRSVEMFITGEPGGAQLRLKDIATIERDISIRRGT